MRRQNGHGATGNARAYGVGAAGQNDRHLRTKHKTGAIRVRQEAKLLCQNVPGLEVGDQKLEFARSATVGIAKMAVDNATGLESESIDDYRVQYASAVVWAMEKTPYLRKALQKAYGERAGLVRLG